MGHGSVKTPISRRHPDSPKLNISPDVSTPSPIAMGGGWGEGRRGETDRFAGGTPSRD